MKKLAVRIITLVMVMALVLGIACVSLAAPNDKKTAQQPTTATAHVYVCLANEVLKSGPQSKDQFSASIGTVTVALSYGKNGKLNTSEVNIFDGKSQSEVDALILGSLPAYDGAAVKAYTVKYDSSDGWHVDCLLATAEIVETLPEEPAKKGNTQIHVHVQGTAASTVTDITVDLAATPDNKTLTLKQTGNVWKVADGGKYVSDDILNVKANGTAVDFTKGTEAGGTINLYITVNAPEPVEEPVKEPVKEEPVEEPVKEPVKEEPVKEPVKEEPVKEPVKEEPVKEPVKEEPVKEPVKEEPVKEPVKEEPVKEEPIQEPVQEQPAETIPLSEPVYEEEIPLSAPQTGDATVTILVVLALTAAALCLYLAANVAGRHEDSAE